MNRVVLVGRLARDPQELRRSTSNVAAINFTIAVDRQQARQEGQPTADFISCVAFNRNAEFVENYLRKGLLVGIDGKLQSRSYDGRDGRKVYVTEVVCDSIQILEPKGTRDVAAPTYEQPRQESNVPAYEERDIAPTIDINDDDLPF